MDYFISRQIFSRSSLLQMHACRCPNCRRTHTDAPSNIAESNNVLKQRAIIFHLITAKLHCELSTCKSKKFQRALLATERMLLRHKVLQPPTPKSHQSRADARTWIVFWHSCVALIKSQVINHHQRAYHRHIATDTACGFFVVAKSPTERSPWAGLVTHMRTRARARASPAKRHK